MRVIRPHAMLVVALSVMVFTSTLSVLVGIYRAPSSFAANEGYVISSPGAPTVFSSTVDVGLAEFFSNSTISHASPEVFAFTSYGGVPVVVRGVDLQMLAETGPSFTSSQMYGSATALEGNRALVGKALMERLHLAVPCNISLSASYESRFEVVHVGGWFESSSSLDDELLVSLDLARGLSGMRHDKVSIIRLPSLTDQVRDAIAPTGPRFAIYDLTSSKSRVVSGEEFELAVSVKNWGTERGQVTLKIVDNWTVPSSPRYSEVITLDSGAETRFTHKSSYTELGVERLEVLIDSEPPQALNLSVEIVPRYLLVSGPSSVARNSSFEVTVTDYTFAPVNDSRVDFLGQTVYTDSSGIARLEARQLGTGVITASFPGFTNGTCSVNVFDGSAYPDEFNPVVSGFSVVPDSFKETETASVRLMVGNEGRGSGYFTGTIRLDGSRQIAVVNLSLGPGESKVATYSLGSMAPGKHSVSLGSSEATFEVYAWYTGEPDLVLLAVRYGGKLSLASATAIPIAQAAKLSQADIEVALISVGAISGVLASFSITSIFAKEIHEARDKLGILRTIGASRKQIRRLIIRQSLVYSFPAALLGAALGLVVSGALLGSGWLVLFGHELRIDAGLSLVPLVLVGTLAICVASALASAEVAVRTTPVASIRKTEEPSVEPRTVDEVIGEE